MAETRTCPQCGTELSADAPQGTCPQCLLKMGLASQPSWPAESEAGGGGNGLFPPGYVPPKPEEIAAIFPQLEIIELLGCGGMGIVYKVRQKHLDRLAALKILPPSVARDPAFAERFQREAKSLAKLNHPHIVTVYDFGQTFGVKEGWYYFLMEFVDGVNLRQMVHAGCLQSHEALAIVPQICDALQYAHDQGIVHRDIKPENLLVDKQGRVKIADFGLAKLMNTASADFRLTGTHQVLGTPLYMAPEQIERTASVDHRADIYSLGVVFYEMLTGELPLGRFAAPSKKVHIDVRLDDPDIAKRNQRRSTAREYLPTHSLFPFFNSASINISRTGTFFRWESSNTRIVNGTGPELPANFRHLWNRYGKLLDADADEKKDAKDEQRPAPVDDPFDEIPPPAIKPPRPSTATPEDAQQKPKSPTAPR